MARLDRLLGRTAYLDTNIFIYAVEGYEPEQDFVRGLFAAIDRSELAAVTSEFTLAELLVKPFELGRHDVAAIYVELVRHSARLSVAPLDRSILIEAARQRAALGILMPDALHVATALATGCDLFLTNDRRIRLPPTLALELL
jgi:predicted nucleic acid-binding protein